MSAGPLVALQAMDIGTDHSCSWAMDPDMVLGSSPSMDDMMPSVGRAGHSDWYGLNGSVVLASPHGPRSHLLGLQGQQKPRTSVRVLVVAGSQTQICRAEDQSHTTPSHTMPW